MKTNKERGFYWVTYTCINCGNKFDKQVTFGKSIPILSAQESEYNEKAPECDRCGCLHWSYGKAQ